MFLFLVPCFAYSSAFQRTLNISNISYLIHVLVSNSFMETSDMSDKLTTKSVKD